MIYNIVSTGGDPSLFVQGTPGPAIGPSQGAPGSFPQFPSWAGFQQQNLPPTVVAWIALAFVLVFVLKSTLRMQG